MTKQLGQSFFVENKPGAGTTIGATEVARAPADGYTMMVVTPTFAIAQYVYPNLPYDGPKDFVPVALLMTTPLLLVVNPATGFKTVGDFVQGAKAKPGQISFSSAGSGSTPHLAFELLRMQAGIDLLHVPYKGGGEAVQALLAGTTNSYFFAPIECGPHLKAGKLVALGASSLKRTPGLAEIPTIAESGLPGFRIASEEARFSSKAITDQAMPAFCAVGGTVSCMYEPSHMKNAASLLPGGMPDDLAEALDYFDSVANRDDLALRFLLEPGEMMLWHNYTNLHSRTAFEDFPDSKRLLLRLWLSVPEGRPVDPAFRIRADTYERIHREALEKATRG